MTPIRVSVVIASRGRPDALRLCLTALSQSRHPAFEVVVVTDAEGQAALASWGDRIRLRRCDEANIGRARNIGIETAAGEVVAFLDDDALPEERPVFVPIERVAQSRDSADDRHCRRFEIGLGHLGGEST